jgi:hypothetical protein
VSKKPVTELKSAVKRAAAREKKAGMDQDAAPKKTVSPAQQALQKMGLTRDIDLALHLPLRYEDETRIVPLKNARDGETVQIEATVTHSEVQLRPRRMLKVTVDDGSSTCVLTFFSFYPSQQKTMAPGARLRIRGEVKGGFWGRQMMHPAFRVAGGELPTALTPVYPASASLPQAYLRRAIASALLRADLDDAPVPAGDVEHPAALAGEERDRLLDVDVLAGGAGHHGHQGVPVVGRGDRDDVDVLAVEDAADVLDVLRLAGRVLELLLVAAGDAWIAVADHHELRIRHAGPLADVLATAAVGPDDGDAEPVIRPGLR